MRSALKSCLPPVLCGLLMACGSAPPPATAPKPAVPLMIASPENESAPASLEARVTQAANSQVLLRFSVETDGQVKDVRATLDMLPPDTSAAVLAAFASLRFRPFLQDGKPRSHEFIYPLFFGPDAVSERTRFFCRHQKDLYRPRSRCEIVTLDGLRLYRVTPPYPESMLSAPVPGAVTLGFDLDPSGVPSNVKVLKSTPPGVFDTAAVVALQQWYFETLDGSAMTATRHASATINFTPPSGGY